MTAVEYPHITPGPIFMPFEVQHDWQASLATPRPLIGERAKTRLLLILFFLWFSLVLIGHVPW